MPKPLGFDPIELDGIMLRWHNEVPDDKQLLSDERTGAVLWLGYLGTTPEPKSGIRATAITVSRKTYSDIQESYSRSQLRDANRKFRLH